MSEGAPFVTVTELAASWRALTTQEQTYATDLLNAAAEKIRAEYRKAFAAEIEQSNPAARTVSIDMVKTAIQTGAYVGHIQYGRIEGQRQKSGRLLNPGGALVLTDYHREQLGIPTRALAQACFDDASDARF
ncbi:head-to-tail adaptor [Gordonia phage MagicMan]|uniref:Head-to-tail connector complex protein n=1 Tax=Gordonia phage Schnabeltier TaxID=1821561 RepID=A0A142K9Z6_9CAUD|nr:head-to-tail connector complex protein [Gordonia phage Schnabeltier]AMS02929.1 head-to-tail connector complex protein [Gordonia phage Schnabeltier]QDM55825.1 head-to-tail adaptor [Gordonia phage MagicMan]